VSGVSRESLIKLAHDGGVHVQKALPGGPHALEVVSGAVSGGEIQGPQQHGDGLLWLPDLGIGAAQVGLNGRSPTDAMGGKFPEGCVERIDGLLCQWPALAAQS
jgi:hypothetical protein